MSIIKYMSVLTTCSVFIAFFSIVYQAFLSLKQLNKKTTILAGLLALENVSRVERPKIAIGYGACIDVLVNGTDFLNFTDITGNIRVDTFLDEINSSAELLKHFAYYFKNGAAAERFVPNETLFKKLIHIATTRYNGQVESSIGGNAPLMALRFSTEGADVLLGARMSEKLKRRLPKDMLLAGDLLEEDDVHLILEYKGGENWGPHTAPRANRYILHSDKSNPQLSSIEVFDLALKKFQPHLLVISGLQMMDGYKYERELRSSDIPFGIHKYHIIMAAAGKQAIQRFKFSAHEVVFGAAVDSELEPCFPQPFMLCVLYFPHEWKAPTVLLPTPNGGLKLFFKTDYTPAGVRESLVKKIQNQMISQPVSTLIHFELASYVEISMLRLLLIHILPYTDSIGMNEQELDNLRQVLEFGKVTLASDWNPRVATTLDQIRRVFMILNEDYFSKRHIEPMRRRMLTRIHVHTLAYQVFVTVKGFKWNNSKNAAAKAALTAHRYVCQSDVINPESAGLVFDDSFATSAYTSNDSNSSLPKRIKLNPSNPVSCWDESVNVLENSIQIEICVSPILICKTVKKTAGAGDNVSAAGLFQQI